MFSTLLNDQMADVAPPATFMYVVGQKHVPCSVKYNTPGGWKVYTGLEKKGDRYFASDYDIFIDAPAFIGEFKVLEFETGGARHHLVFSKPNISMSATASNCRYSGHRRGGGGDVRQASLQGIHVLIQSPAAGHQQRRALEFHAHHRW